MKTHISCTLFKM